MEQLIKFRMLSECLTDEEYQQFFQQFCTNNETAQIQDFMFDAIKLQIQKYDDSVDQPVNVKSINQLLSDILNSREPLSEAEDTDYEENTFDDHQNESIAYTIDHFPQDIIGEISTYLSSTTYVVFQLCNRAIFQATRHPSIRLSDMTTKHIIKYSPKMKSNQFNIHKLSLNWQLIKSCQLEQFTFWNNLKQLHIQPTTNEEIFEMSLLNQNDIDIKRITKLINKCTNLQSLSLSHFDFDSFKDNGVDIQYLPKLKTVKMYNSSFPKLFDLHNHQLQSLCVQFPAHKKRYEFHFKLYRSISSVPMNNVMPLKEVYLTNLSTNLINCINDHMIANSLERVYIEHNSKIPIISCTTRSIGYYYTRPSAIVIALTKLLSQKPSLKYIEMNSLSVSNTLDIAQVIDILCEALKNKYRDFIEIKICDSILSHSIAEQLIILLNTLERWSIEYRVECQFFNENLKRKRISKKCQTDHDKRMNNLQLWLMNLQHRFFIQDNSSECLGHFVIKNNSITNVVQNKEYYRLSFNELTVDHLFDMFHEWYQENPDLSKNTIKHNLQVEYGVTFENSIKRDNRINAALAKLKAKYANL
eukprot:7905_1